MKHTIKMIPTIAVVVTLGIAWMGVARADSLDHMRCSRVTGPATVASSAADLDTVAFGTQTGCVVKGAARELCVPAAGDVLAPPPASDAVRGEALLDERLCYALSCPAPGVTAFVASDRFGTRTITLKKAKRFCTPVMPAMAENATP
jgi:hypothetical protein